MIFDLDEAIAVCERKLAQIPWDLTVKIGPDQFRVRELKQETIDALKQLPTSGRRAASKQDDFLVDLFEEARPKMSDWSYKIATAAAAAIMVYWRERQKKFVNFADEYISREFDRQLPK